MNDIIYSYSSTLLNSFILEWEVIYAYHIVAAHFIWWRLTASNDSLKLKEIQLNNPG